MAKARNQYPLSWEILLDRNRPRRVVVELEGGASAFEVFVPRAPLPAGQELVLRVELAHREVSLPFSATSDDPDA